MCVFDVSQVIMDRQLPNGDWKQVYYILYIQCIHRFITSKIEFTLAS